MTSTFERIYQTDPARESIAEIESLSTALSDQEYLERIRRDSHAIDLRQDIEIPIELREAMSKVIDKIKKPKRTKKVVV